MTEEEFISKIWSQNCGDNIKVKGKSSIKKNGKYLYECEFQKYPYQGFFFKQKIIDGSVLNPEIENSVFIGKIFKQLNCSLKVIEKTNTKNPHGSDFLYKCFCLENKQEYLYPKEYIKRGKISIDDFSGKIFKQNCGDFLKVIKKSTIHLAGINDYPFECEFQNYPCKIIARKGHILSGCVDNPLLPWKRKDLLLNFIQKEFPENKPTLKDLADRFSVKITWIGHQINEFQLNDYINYSFEGSYLEENVRQYLNSLISSDKEISNNNWSLLDGKEIDIYIPNKKIGIEFNGNYWHSELYKSSNYHQEKSLLAQSKGISLMHIFEYEWNEKQEILKALIKSKLGIFENKIPARKCKIRELQNKEYQDFCNKNHLQGEAGARIKLGLFFEGELVQILSFGVPRFTNKYEWEIIRECSKSNYCIIGGKEKLWKYFLRKYNPKSCISYCDFSKFEGNSYIKLGFKKERLNKPGFVWWDQQSNITFWRTPSKNQEYKNKGYLKIYDVGQLVFIWKIN